MKQAFSIFISISVCILVGLTASNFQADAIQNWYPTLHKSPLTPPNTLFPIVWSILYICMGVSVGLILLLHAKGRNQLLALFAAQLFCNFIWSILFFYYQNPLLGFIDILLLDILVTIYTIRSYRINRASSYLFIPYLIWIYFASYLNGYLLLYN